MENCELEEVVDTLRKTKENIPILIQVEILEVLERIAHSLQVIVNKLEGKSW